MDVDTTDDLKPQDDENQSEEVKTISEGALAVQLVYNNYYLMSKILSYVHNYKDRINLECSSKWLNFISSRTSYYANGEDNTKLDIHFANLKPLATMSIAGSEVTFQVLTMADRNKSSEERKVQPEMAITCVDKFLQRFWKQIRCLSIGGTTDFERRVGFIPEHILVVTRDLCVLLDRFTKVNSLTLRDCCLSSEAVEHWRAASSSPLIERTRSLCLHGIYLDCLPDCATFFEMISLRVRRLCLSECSGKVISSMCDWMKRVQARMDFIFFALDFRTFADRADASKAFMDLSDFTDELHICVLRSSFLYPMEYRKLALLVSDLPYQSRISVLEVDFGYIERSVVALYERFFRGFRFLKNLRVLHLKGCPLRGKRLWWSFIDALRELGQLRELSLNTLLKNRSSRDIFHLLDLLPESLVTLSLKAMRISDQNLGMIAEKCPKLVTIYLDEIERMTSFGVMKLLRECSKLREVAVCGPALVPDIIYDTLYVNVESKIDALIVSNNRSPPSEGLRALMERFFLYLKAFDVSPNIYPNYEYHMWRTDDAYRHLLASAGFADCPVCGTDVGLTAETEIA